MFKFFLKLKKKQAPPQNKFLAYQKNYRWVEPRRNWHALLLTFFVFLALLVLISTYLYAFFFNVPRPSEETESLLNGVTKEKLADVIRVFDERKNIFNEYVNTPPSVIDPSL